MIDVWLVRHGQTDWNVEKRVQGWTDVPLNRTGLRQAQLLAAALQGIPFQAIYSSDLIRARTTASILQSQVRAPLRIDRRLRERYFGSAEGTVRAVPMWSSGREENMALAALSHDVSANPIDDKEPAIAVRTRVMQFLTTLTQRHKLGRFLCVSHGGVIRALLDGLGAAQHVPLQNTSVTRIQWNGEEWRILFVNWNRHLQGPSSN